MHNHWVKLSLCRQDGTSSGRLPVSWVFRPSISPIALRRGFLTKAGGWTPKRKPGRAAILGQMWSVVCRPTSWTVSCLPCVCVANYQGKFQPGGPDVGRYAILELHARNDDDDHIVSLANHRPWNDLLCVEWDINSHCSEPHLDANYATRTTTTNIFKL